MPLGSRVPTKNPKLWEFDDSLPEPDESTWRQVDLTLSRDDGTIVDIELLRPSFWVEAQHLIAGGRFHVNLPELEISGFAEIHRIAPCPRLATGDGSVITGRFVTRQVDVIARVEILGADGSIEVLEGTPIHPIWSLDRNDWVPLGELEEGEQLLGQAGPATVLSATIHNQTTAIYNIEVHGEHVYQVGTLGLLVHNACVYQARDSVGNIIYVGITNNFGRRAAEHASRFVITPIKNGISRFDARAIEQALIDKHGLSGNGGALLNKINSIGPGNPIYASAIARSKSLGF